MATRQATGDGILFKMNRAGEGWTGLSTSFGGCDVQVKTLPRATLNKTDKKYFLASLEVSTRVTH